MVSGPAVPHRLPTPTSQKETPALHSVVPTQTDKTNPMLCRNCRLNPQSAPPLSPGPSAFEFFCNRIFLSRDSLASLRTDRASVERRRFGLCLDQLDDRHHSVTLKVIPPRREHLTEPLEQLISNSVNWAS